MSENDGKVPLPDLEGNGAIPPVDPNVVAPDPPADDAGHSAADLEAVFDVPVKVSAVLGRARMEVGELLRRQAGLQAFGHHRNIAHLAQGDVRFADDDFVGGGVLLTVARAQDEHVHARSAANAIAAGRPSALSAVATMLFASSPAVSYIRSGVS